MQVPYLKQFRNRKRSRKVENVRLCQVANLVFWFAVERKKRLPRVDAHI